MTNKINYYQWQGLNRHGEKLTGSLAAPNLAVIRPHFSGQQFFLNYSLVSQIPPVYCNRS